MFYCFLADGFEETEALAPVDILRRADIDVCTVGVGGDVIRGAHNIDVTADINIDDFELNEDIRGVILPGGMPGVKNLYADGRVLEAVRFCDKHGLYVCAICAAPSIPGRLGLLEGKRATCFPGFENELKDAEVTGARTETDGNVITACGMGAATEFALALLSKMKGEAAAEEMRAAILAK